MWDQYLQSEDSKVVGKSCSDWPMLVSCSLICCVSQICSWDS